LFGWKLAGTDAVAAAGTGGARWQEVQASWRPFRFQAGAVDPVPPEKLPWQ
jgi:hypothetical protein